MRISDLLWLGLALAITSLVTSPARCERSCCDATLRPRLQPIAVPPPTRSHDNDDRRGLTSGRAMDDRAKNLYAVALEEFVSERNALARALREAGDQEAAAGVRALRKPTVSAWALNQLPRQRSRQLDRLLEAADQLGQAQVQAMSRGSNPAELRPAMIEYREALEDLSREAADILERAGASPAAHMADITASLQAAAVDEEARRHLREGTLTRPLTSPGFAGLAPDLAMVAESGPSGTDKSLLQQSSREELATARRALEEAHERERRARQQLESLMQTVDQLMRAAERARKRAERLAAEAEEAEKEAREAEQSADQASEAVRRARTELEEAKRAIKEAEGLASPSRHDRPDT